LIGRQFKIFTPVAKKNWQSATPYSIPHTRRKKQWILPDMTTGRGQLPQFFALLD